MARRDTVSYTHLDVYKRQGLNKSETAKQYGDAQVLTWRRSYDTPPPALEPTDPRSERSDIRYAKLSAQQIPLTECLKDTVARVMPVSYTHLRPAGKATSAR